MRFLADRAVGHSARLKPLDDCLNWLHLLNGDRFGSVLECHQAAQGGRPFGLVIDEFGVLFERGVIVGAAGLL